jgi:ATP-dependent DNA helicase RecG
VRDLEKTVRDAAQRALRLAIPRDPRRVLEALVHGFAEPLEGPARLRAARRALARVRPLADRAWPERALERPLTSLLGIGARRAELLERRGLRTVCDLLLHLPTRYEDRRSLVKVAELDVGRRATFLARVLLCDFAPRRGKGGRFRRVFRAVVEDETGHVTLKWFHGGEMVQERLRKGASLLVTGDVRRYRFSKEILHPEIESVDDGAGPEALELESLRQIVPVYGGPEAIPARAMRRYAKQAVETHADLIPSHLPGELARQRELPEVSQALREIHAPSAEADLDALRRRATPAHERLVLEELYLLEVGLALRRAARVAEPGIPIRSDGSRARQAPLALPFHLTGAQRRVLAEIASDLGRLHPMNRLLQGDVGSGKTAVAFLAAIAVAESGFQSALMAPTELLAEQHARTLRRLAESGGEATGLRAALLTASVPKVEAERIRRDLARGTIELVVGTHALVQEEVSFARLALAVVDEQHRFGVLQRAALAAKGAEGRSPHVLVMTATPIPRTLALTLYGELDLSVLDELPPGRTPVTTNLLRSGEGSRVMELIRRAVKRGEQVYVVYPLVEESEKSDLRAAAESAQRIQSAFPELCVDLVHGRLEAQARAEAMARFERGETQILISTTVIEVGVDVPNATLMVVEHAERFGLAQLHQLRGRVGRASKPGTCLLLARGSTEESEARLRALLETTDGFEIADADLRIRGPGEFLGTRQSGRLPDLRVADLLRDRGLVSVARDAALATVRRDPGLRRAPELAHAVRARWGDRLVLVDVG